MNKYSGCHNFPLSTHYITLTVNHSGIPLNFISVLLLCLIFYPNACRHKTSRNYPAPNNGEIIQILPLIPISIGRSRILNVLYRSSYYRWPCIVTFALWSTYNNDIIACFGSLYINYNTFRLAAPI